MAEQQSENAPALMLRDILEQMKSWQDSSGRRCTLALHADGSGWLKREGFNNVEFSTVDAMLLALACLPIVGLKHG